MSAIVEKLISLVMRHVTKLNNGGLRRNREIKQRKCLRLCLACFLFWNFLLSREHTCAHDRCKHPALAVLDRAVARVGPHLQDVAAAGPRAGVHPLFEVRGPVPLQHAPVVFAVDLDEKEETKVRTLQAPVGVHVHVVHVGYSDSVNQLDKKHFLPLCIWE